MTLAVETPLRTVGALPGTAARLLADGLEEAAAYREAGGYRPLADAEAFLAEIEAAGLRGRGGASFPAAVKLRAVRSAAGEAFAIANGEEGEPASAKDRWLLRHRPHLVLDGLRLAAEVVGASRACVYLSDPLARQQVEAALAAAKPHLLRILGPNCVGIIVPQCGLNASFAHTNALPGKIAFVSQSGALVTSVLGTEYAAASFS